jgi:hypothetical protein
MDESKAGGLEDARSAKDAATALLRDLPGFSGLGITRVKDRYALKVLLSEAPPRDLPRSVEGVPLVVTVTGPIRKRSGVARTK